VFTAFPIKPGNRRERELFSHSLPDVRLFLACWIFLLLALSGTAQTNPPPVSYIRSYTNDVPNQPLISVAVTGASNVACFTIEEVLPAPATVLNVSSDGVYLPALNVIRWGPYFNMVATNVSYRLAGLPASYPVSGGAWMDGHWNFSSGVTLVTVLPASGNGGTPTPPPQVATPAITITPAGTVPLFNGSFETPGLSEGSSVYFDAMTTAQQVLFGWNGSGNYTNGPALFDNSSPWNYVTVSNGLQAVSLESNSVVSQTINFYAAGTCTLNWLAASRQGQTNPAVVKVDGTTVYSWQATNTAWQPFSTPVTIATAGNHTISFAGLGTGSTDVSVGLDAVGLVGTNVPASMTIFSATPGATIYYTTNGTVPTTSSLLYTGAIYLTSASVVRAVAFTNGWAPSVASVAYYGPPAVPANAQVTRSVNTSSPTAPVVTFSVTPGTNASCEAVTEALMPGLGASNVSSGGNYIASNNVVLWGPFFGTNVQTLSYQAVGQPGVYLVRASWSVDGVGGSEAAGTNIVIASAGNLVPTPPQQVTAPLFLPASGTNVPVSVTVTDATPGAVIYYSLDGSLPTQSSLLYTGKVSLASASVIRVVAFTNGWTPSVASVAYYGPPAVPANAQLARSINTSSPTAPVVTFSVTPGSSAQCVAVTETLPPGVGANNVTSGGNYIASNNVVKWGPFFGTNALSLSYQAVGQPGVYPVSVAWSVDGIGGSEATGTNLVIASAGSLIPTPPQLVPTPVMTPALASNLPVMVSISDSDSQAQIYYTIDGTLPTQSSTLYTGTLIFSTQTTLRAVAFHNGYLPSVSAVGQYVPVLNTNTVPLPQNISDNGSFLPTVSLMATPQGTVNCYAVVEPIPTGLMPSGLSGDGIWDPVAGVIRWGPYLDNQARVFSFNVGGPSGTYPLTGQVSFNGYSAGTTGASLVQINANYIGALPATNLAACATDYLTYNVNINPAPGVIIVTNATGTVNWGDGTQSAITNPVMTFAKSYSTVGTYGIVVTANWWGYSGNTPMSGQATKSDLVQVVTTCIVPQITTQPTNQVVFAGSTVQFTVSASSSVPMTYQWYFNQALPIVGTVFSSLTLPNVAPQSSGNYSVIITNAFGSITSSIASLSVVTPLVTNIVKSTNGRVTLNFVGLPNATTRLWATTNLALPASWQPIFTNTTTSTNGTWQFTDTNAVGYPARFYRFSTP
jgi:hypothetical protein